MPTSADDLVSLPDLSLVGQFNLLADWRVGIATMLMLVLTLLLADFFDTMGTMVGVAGQAGLTDKDGNVPNSQGVLVADALGTVVGGAASASVATTYAESAAGVGEGARTGIAPIVTGLLFIGAMFITPLAVLVPAEAATPVLVAVGFLMMTQITKVDFTDLGIGIPAFLAIDHAYTYSIANGIGVAFIAYTIVRTAQGRWRDVHPLMLLISLVFLIHFAEAPIQALLG